MGIYRVKFLKIPKISFDVFAILKMGAFFLVAVVLVSWLVATLNDELEAPPVA